MRRRTLLLFALVAVVCVGIWWLGSIARSGLNDRLAAVERKQERQVKKVKRQAKQNRRVICRLGKLVAYVPADQFPGESLSNFINWINAREGMLNTIGGPQICTPEVVEALRRRTRIDEMVLEALEADR